MFQPSSCVFLQSRKNFRVLVLQDQFESDLFHTFFLGAASLGCCSQCKDAFKKQGPWLVPSIFSQLPRRLCRAGWWNECETCNGDPLDKLGMAPFGRHVFCCTMSGTIENLGKSRRHRCPDFQRMRGFTEYVNVHIKDDHFSA